MKWIKNKIRSIKKRFCRHDYNIYLRYFDDSGEIEITHYFCKNCYSRTVKYN